MIRKILKTSVVAIALLGTANMSYAQENADITFPSKLSIELVSGIHAPNLDIKVNALDGLNDLGIFGALGQSMTDLVPDADQGFNVGLRGNYKFWKDVSGYGQFGYSRNSAKDIADVQSIIDPFLLLLSLAGDNSIIDPSSIRVNVNKNGNYELISANLGLRYDYRLQDKFNIGVYGGVGFYSLTTPGLQVDLSADVTILGAPINIPLNNILELERYTESTIGWQGGIDLTYQLNNTFYTGLNFEYNYAELDYSSMGVSINEESIPSLLSGFLPIDLSTTSDIPLATDIKLSSFKYGIVFGMRL